MQIVISEEELENVNAAMVMVLDYSHNKFGTQYVCEDGRITEIIRPKVTIRAK